MPTLNASRQIRFHQLLVGARKKWLNDALSEALAKVDPQAVKAQLAELVPLESQKLLASSGIRDEHVFPVPAVLEAMPTLVGYYRLLLGVPQKSFYGQGTGMGRFKTMEMRGIASARQIELLPEFCAAMAPMLSDLVQQISPTVTSRDIYELPILTLGSQIQGANNNIIGRLATNDVFQAVADIVEKHLVQRQPSMLVIQNSAGRLVKITLSADPDIRIDEQLEGRDHPIVAIEIKGGTDRSNAHNRAGEAEKSHQKARALGYTQCWTIIAKRGLDIATLQRESPTSNYWFDVSHVLAREGEDWNDFRTNLVLRLSIPVD